MNPCPLNRPRSSTGNLTFRIADSRKNDFILASSASKLTFDMKAVYGGCFGTVSRSKSGARVDFGAVGSLDLSKTKSVGALETHKNV